MAVWSICHRTLPLSLSLFSTAGNIPTFLASPWLYKFLILNVLEFIPFYSFVGRYPQGATVETKRGFCFSCRRSRLCSLDMATISLCGQSCWPLHYPGVSRVDSWTWGLETPLAPFLYTWYLAHTRHRANMPPANTGPKMG